MPANRRDAAADYAALQRYREAMGEMAALVARAEALLAKLAEDDRG